MVRHCTTLHERMQMYSEEAHGNWGAAGAETERRRPERPRFLLVSEAAEVIRLDPSTLYRHLRADRFPAVKIGGRYLIPEAVVTQMAREAVESGRCVVVEDWAASWRERLADEAVARGTSIVPIPRDMPDDDRHRSYSERNRPRSGANQSGAGSPISHQSERERYSMTDRSPRPGTGGAR